MCKAYIVMDGQYAVQYSLPPCSAYISPRQVAEAIPHTQCGYTQ